jgi:hypothetical protein
MTDAHDFDELASAHLDGATSPEEAALVASDPALQARVEELRVVRDAIRESPAVDPARRDAAIAAALDAFDDAAAPGVPAAPVTALAPRRAPTPTLVRVLGVAAVFVLLALLAVPLLGNLGDGGDDEASFEATSDDLGGADAATGDDTGAEAAESPDLSTTVPTPTAGLAPSTYADLDALAAAVAAGDFTANRSSTQDSAFEEADAFCSTPGTPNTQVATAVVAGDPVIVWIRSSSDGTRQLTVLSADGCEVLDEREL